MNPQHTIALFAAIASLMGLGREAPAAQTATPALAEHERILDSYLRGFNAGNTAALTEFAKTYLSEAARHGESPAQIAQRDLEFRQEVGGGFDLCRIERNTATELVAILKSQGEFPLYARLSLTFEGGRPGLVARRGIQPASPPADALPPRQRPDRLTAELDAKLTRMAGRDGFSGVVLIAKDGKPVWQKAYGLADRETQTANNLDTRFRLGSMNKMITSVAIAQLVEAGKLRYTETLAEALPDYPDREVAQKITLHHLLTHTSGMGDIFTPEFDKKKDQLRDIKDYLPLFVHQPLRFAPGTGWAYSNAGFIVLGLVIEKAAGQSYYDYVQQHIYNVARMTASGSYPKSDKIPNLAVGYMRPERDAPLIANWDTLPWRGMSAGGGDSTLRDLLRFDQALRHHKLLSAKLTDTVLTGKVQPGPEADHKYAYGFEEARVAGHHIVGHSGGAPGMSAQLDMYLDNGMTVVVLSNLDPPIAELVASYIRLRLP